MTNRNTLKLYASAKAVINDFLHLPGQDRIKNIVTRVIKMADEEVEESLNQAISDFAGRHRNIKQVFIENFDRACSSLIENICNLSISRKLILGAFFTKEYSIEAAALFNPSIVPHFDQNGLQSGQQRFIMSLRATGEGHISSIVFKTGMIDQSLNITFDLDTGYFTRMRKNTSLKYSKDFVESRSKFYRGFNTEVLAILPDSFTSAEALSYFERRADLSEGWATSAKQLEEIFDTNYDLDAPQLPINELVIFPNARAERMGMEDARFVQFKDGKKVCYYGLYTAYDGNNIRTQLIETKDFQAFSVRTLYGAAISDKGMALFPEKINGQYAMIARQGGEKITIMFSKDLYVWENFEVLLEPQYEWELVQLGNCGSPIKTERGWLLLIHGVGIMRTYVISAILLDLHNPAKVVARLTTPLIRPEGLEREGYVPNVVYTCGVLKHGNGLFIPYAMSDSATGFATVSLTQLLDQMKK